MLSTMWWPSRRPEEKARSCTVAPSSSAPSLALTGARPAAAGQIVSFDRTAFAAAQKAGRSIVVFVHAPW